MKNKTNINELDHALHAVYKKIIPDITLAESKKIANYIDKHNISMDQDNYQETVKWIYKKIKGGEINI